jgi:hypothetical protein
MFKCYEKQLKIIRITWAISFCSRELRKPKFSITTQQLNATAYNERNVGLLVFFWR